MSKNIIADKSYSFALSIIKIYKLMVGERKEFVLSKQLLKDSECITAIEFESVFPKAEELVRILVSIVKRTKERRIK